jgi:hypothetical protein
LDGYFNETACDQLPDGRGDRSPADSEFDELFMSDAEVAVFLAAVVHVLDFKALQHAASS